MATATATENTKTAETETDDRLQIQVPKNKTSITALTNGEQAFIEQHTGVKILKAIKTIEGDGDIDNDFLYVVAWVHLRRADIKATFDQAKAFDLGDLYYYLKLGE